MVGSITGSGNANHPKPPLVRVGVVGVGFGSNAVLPALSKISSTEVIAVCAAHRETAELAASRFEVPSAFDDFQCLVETEDIDLICICTPGPLHATMTHAALNAGKHVFTAKPLALEDTRALELAQTAAQLGLASAMDFDLRYDPARRYFRDLVQQGYLGDIRLVLDSVFVDYVVNPAFKIHYWGWHSLRESGSGLLGASLLHHHVDMLRYLFGEIVSVNGLARTLVEQRPTVSSDYDVNVALGPDTPVDGMKLATSEDTALLVGTFASGGLFSLIGSTALQYGSGSRLEAYGSKGTIVLDNSGRLFGALAGASKVEEIQIPAPYHLHDIGGDYVSRFGMLFTDMAAAIQGSVSHYPFATFDDGTRAVEIATSILDS